ncbi:hypothetical protein [Floridanema evergladense]|uniref:Uncharacterized protein n=1 Tax=Floridaenema evergladense BLCC-F167 TaxID=3153639 RepID=A0ABV4WF02_9CYAN
MNSIKKLAGFLGVLGISSLLSLPGFAEVNFNQFAQNSPGQSTSNPINDRDSSNDSNTPGGVSGTNAVDDPCVNQGTRGDRGSSSTSANSRNSSRSSSYPSADDQSLTAQNERCLEQEDNNSSTDSSTTPGIRNTPDGSITNPSRSTGGSRTPIQ